MSETYVPGYSPLPEPGLQRTDMHCHNCNKNFIAEIDYREEGNHVVHCPHCDHEHFRVIKAGKITDDRWNSSLRTIQISPRSVWKSDIIEGKTSTVSQFMRDRWLNREDLQL